MSSCVPQVELVEEYKRLAKMMSKMKARAPAHAAGSPSGLKPLLLETHLAGNPFRQKPFRPETLPGSNTSGRNG